MSGKRPRRSQRLDAQKFGFTRTVRDDPTLEIASYSDKPIGWNRSLRDKYSCTPNSKSYRVLSQLGAPCPLEAKLVDPDNNVCCTSRVTYPTQQESLDFFKYLKAIYYNIPMNLRTLDHIPPSLRRLLQWITSNDNTSEIRFAGYNHRITVDSEHERFLEILKFAMMSGSQIKLIAVQNTGAPPNPSFEVDPVFNNRSHNNASEVVVDDRLVGRHGVSLFDEIVRITNDTGGVSRALVVVHTPPATTVGLPRVNGRTVHFGLRSAMFAVDLSDIIDWVVACDNNGWNIENTDINHRAVTSLPAHLTLNDLMLPLFSAVIAKRTRRVRVFTDAPPPFLNNNVAQIVAVPPGFRPITIAPNQVTGLAVVLSNWVNGTNLTAQIPGRHYTFFFQSPAFPHVPRRFQLIYNANLLHMDVS